MILEYLFLDKKSQPDIEDFNAKILNGKIKEGKLHIIYKEFDEADYWAVRYEYGKNSELDALYLSDLNEDIITVSGDPTENGGGDDIYPF